MTYFVIDIETVPLTQSASEEERLEKLNPIDSRIVAIGIRHDGVNKTWHGDEKEILTDAWKHWNSIAMNNRFIKIVGFNVANFDLPFMTARSFILGVQIVPFVLKNVIDIRDKINAYRYGPSRGKLKEFAELLNLPVLDVDGGDVDALWQQKDYETLVKYLENDLEITDAMYQRLCELRIADVQKW